MKTGLQVLLWLSVVGWGVVLNYCSRCDKVITWAIGYVAPENLTKQEANVYRAALSPKQYLRAINLQLGLPFLILVVGSYIRWYLGVAALLISVMIMYGVLSRLAPGSVDKYLFGIVMGLQHKAADYKKDGDSERLEAANDLLVPLKRLYEQVRGKQHKIPTSGNINLPISKGSHKQRAEARAQEMVEAMNDMAHKT